ncbi:hypothetical protein [Canibacter oris]|uniref:Uncharacterized protein n=1 Tax=Canibacter oris TaxID=1365628 RepID=A0A840DG91_9MICO|nr:hypothetical protein [Canibacter oris]MBB4072054.1 hypothetical protein [Canibacter oris]
MDKQAKTEQIGELFKREKSPAEQSCLQERGYCLSDMCEILHHSLKHLYDDEYINMMLEDLDGNHYYWIFYGLSRLKTKHQIETPEELKPLLKRFFEDPDDWYSDTDDIAAEHYPEIEYEWVDEHGFTAADAEETQTATA